MRLPRDVAGEELARLLGKLLLWKLGYTITLQTSHLRLTREGPEHLLWFGLMTKPGGTTEGLKTYCSVEPSP